MARPAHRAFAEDGVRPRRRRRRGCLVRPRCGRARTPLHRTEQCAAPRHRGCGRRPGAAGLCLRPEGALRHPAAVAAHRGRCGAGRRGDAAAVAAHLRRHRRRAVHRRQAALRAQRRRSRRHFGLAPAPSATGLPARLASGHLAIARLRPEFGRRRGARRLWRGALARISGLLCADRADDGGSLCRRSAGLEDAPLRTREHPVGVDRRAHGRRQLDFGGSARSAGILSGDVGRELLSVPAAGEGMGLSELSRHRLRPARAHGRTRQRRCPDCALAGNRASVRRPRRARDVRRRRALVRHRATARHGGDRGRDRRDRAVSRHRGHHRRPFGRVSTDGNGAGPLGAANPVAADRRERAPAQAGPRSRDACQDRAL